MQKSIKIPFLIMAFTQKNLHICLLHLMRGLISIPQTPQICFHLWNDSSLLERAHIWSAPTVICSLMDMDMLLILKLPEWLVSTDGWGLMPPHNDVPALFKVTAFCWGVLQPLGDRGKRYRGLVQLFRNLTVPAC